MKYLILITIVGLAVGCSGTKVSSRVLSKTSVLNNEFSSITINGKKESNLTLDQEIVEMTILANDSSYIDTFLNIYYGKWIFEIWKSDLEIDENGDYDEFEILFDRKFLFNRTKRELPRSSILFCRR